MNPVAQVQNLDIAFGDRTVLSDVDLTIPRNRVVVLMGPGGSGKSTFVRALTDTLTTDAADVSGQITYCGEQPTPSFLRQNPGASLTTVYEFLASAHPHRADLTRSTFRRKLVDYLERRQMARLTGRLDEQVVAQPSDIVALLQVVRAALERRALVCLDEPTSGLTDSEGRPLVDFIRRESDARAFLIVTHNQSRARQLADHVALMASGQIVEHRPASEFFDAPQTASARQFLETGSCSMTPADVAINPNGPDRSTDPESTAPASDSPSIPAPDDIGSEGGDSDQPASETDASERSITYRHPSEVRGPQGFRWLIGARLGASPIPGATRPLEHDLRALERIGVTLLVTLTQTPLADTALEAVDFENIHFPIPDMHAPDLEAAARLCGRVADWLRNGGVVVFHCRAGKGRAGTMLCAMLVWAGHSADCALSWARSIYKKWVQTRQQEDFLKVFQRWLAEHQPDRQARLFSSDLATHHCSCN